MADELTQDEYEKALDNEVDDSGEVIEREKFTTWANEPTLADLKKNLDDTDANDQTHIDNVARWLSNLYVEGSAKINSPKGSSKLQPKLIRKQAEWRYSSLSEPFLASPDLYNIYPVTAGDNDSPGTEPSGPKNARQGRLPR